MKIRGTTVGTPIKPEKVVVKCKNLTEEEKAIARANIGAASEEVIGLIDTTLAAIINYQEEFIGTDDNVSTITFFIDGMEYTAEKGMTFGDWVDSEYNTGGCYLSGQYLYDSNGAVYENKQYEAHVQASTEIIDGAEYNAF